MTTFLSKSVGAVCSDKERFLKHLGDITDPVGKETTIVAISNAHNATRWGNMTTIRARGAWVSSDPPASSTVTLSVALINKKGKVVGKEVSTSVSPSLGGGCNSRTMAIVTVRYDEVRSRFSFSVRKIKPPPSAVLRVRFSWKSSVTEMDSGLRFLNKKMHSKCGSQGSFKYVNGLFDEKKKTGTEEATIAVSKAFDDNRWNGSVRIPLFAHWVDEYARPGASLATVSATLSDFGGNLISGNVTRAINPGPPATCPGRRVAVIVISYNRKSRRFSMHVTSVARRPPTPDTLRLTFTWSGRRSDLKSGGSFLGKKANSVCNAMAPFISHLGNDNTHEGREVVVVALSAARKAGAWVGRRTEVKLHASWNSKFNLQNESRAIVTAAVYKGGNNRVTPIFSRRVLPGLRGACPGALRRVGTVLVLWDAKTGKYGLSIGTRAGPMDI